MNRYVAVSICLISFWGMKPAKASEAPAPAPHWAFVKPVDRPAPAVKNAAWVKDPIDAWVLAGLEAHQLSPAAQADKRTLIRRASFDLIGMPPTPEQVDAFLADSSPDAFAHVVDELLASPHYGERWGRYWLDVARYSDTKGYVFREERRYPYAYTFRDYVIRSLNEDKPYDRFLMEQIAADRMNVGEDKHALAAMGYITLGRRFINNIHDIIDDRMDVVCRGMMGLTIGCARCHSHKFDPIPISDYYSLYTIFNNSREATDLPLIEKAPDTPETRAYEAHVAELQGKVDAYLAESYKILIAEQRTEKTIAAALYATKKGKVDHEAFAAGLAPNPYMLHRWRLAMSAAGQAKDKVFYGWRAFMLIPEEQFAQQAPVVAAKLAKSPNCIPRVAELFAKPPASMQDVAERYAGMLVSFLNDEAKKDAWADADAKPIRDFILGDGSPLNVPLADVEKLFKRDRFEHLTKLRGAVTAYKAASPVAPPRAMALEDVEHNATGYIYLRGNPGMPGDKVKPHFLTCIAGSNAPEFTQGSGRLELAQAVASRDNPLTARVMVNRVWLHHFGFGIVRTPSDFGTRSDPPTHPELLDHLAVQFMNNGWSLKKLHKQIMLSATYQMTSNPSPTAAKQDPQNLYLSHFNRQRLDFEATRDALVWAGGKMDLTMYGKSVDITTEPFSLRRSVYAYIDRQNLPGLFRSFDFASPDTTCPRRFVTTAPQQALFMMNSSSMMEQVRNVLDRPDIKGLDGEQKIAQLYRLLFDRKPTQDEKTLGLAYVAGEAKQPEEAIVWQYGFGEFDASANRTKTFNPLPFFTGSAYQGSGKLPDKKTGYCMLNARGGHPGAALDHAVIRRWTANADAVVQISGTLAHNAPNGDGVHGQIVCSSRGELASWNVFQSKAQTDIDRVAVRRGDTIDFIVDCRKTTTSDSFTWAPVIRIADVPSAAGVGVQEEWNATADFGGPSKITRSLTPWEKYVQVLLETNEFVFVD